MSDRPPGTQRATHIASRIYIGSDAAVPELICLARTMDALREALLAYFGAGGFSNGPRETMNW